VRLQQGCDQPVSLVEIRPVEPGEDEEPRPRGLGFEADIEPVIDVPSIESVVDRRSAKLKTVAARFWGEPPIQQAHGSYRKLITDHGLDIADASRFMAMTTVVAADALIACFDAKYRYAFWRPITAMRAGDTDGNPDTVADPSWLHLLPATPNHPEYPSAHSCLTPATGLVIARFLGTREIDFTIPSLTGLGDRHYDTVADLEYEVTNARIWGGIHYRTSVEVGTEIGKKVERQVLAHHFHRSR
jgi:hypothetical protein